MDTSYRRRASDRRHRPSQLQAHTVSHRDLVGLDFDSQVAEIAENKSYLEQITGQKVSFLAWPR
jgi:hypothetical protein